MNNREAACSVEKLLDLPQTTERASQHSQVYEPDNHCFGTTLQHSALLTVTVVP